MKLNAEVTAAASERIDRTQGAALKAPIAARAAITLSADRLAKVARYINENRAPTDTFALERAFGTNDLVSLYYLWSGIRASSSVARIVIAPGPGDPGGFATGFMVAPNLLLTNYHVFPAAEVAERSRAQFAYEADSDGNERVSTWFSFAPNLLFVNDQKLDYAMVAVNPDSKQGPDPLPSFGWLRLNPQLGKADYGQFLSIVQHPGGQAKQLAIRENEVLPFDDADDFLVYRSDTFRGSSGSPVFNDLWDVVALHHAGKPMKDADGHFIGHDGKPILDPNPDEADVKWLANEGARTSRIVTDFRKRAPQGDLRQSLEAIFDGRVKPPAQSVESAPGATPSPIVPLYSPSRNTQGPIAPAGGFVVVLPLNVAIKVESLVNGPPAAAASLPVPTIISKHEREDEELAFEKLNFDREYSDRRGYDDAFLGRSRLASMPTIASASASKIAPTRDRDKVLHYHHYSAMIHAERRMPVLTACNADYTKDLRQIAGRKTFGKDEWIIDERMDPKYQLPRGFYDRWKKLDYGHLVRREDNCWGASPKEIEYANADSFHLTNCTPQHEAFNRSNLKGIWGSLENHIGSQASGERLLNRLCIFAGPIFGKKDLLLKDADGDVYVPLAFWKVMVAPTERSGLRSFGFVLTQAKELQTDKPFEEFTPEGFEEEQKTLEQIEKQTMVRFSAELKKVDAMLNHPQGLEVMPLTSVEDVWLGRL